MNIEVETRINAVGDAEPYRFRVGGRCLEVAEVTDRWLDSMRGYFKVRASDGATYILRFESATGNWDVAVYDSGRRPPAPASPPISRRH